MKFLSIVTLGLCAATATARSSQATLVDDDALAVPGENPLHYCATPDENILEIKQVDLSPNPPQA